MIPSAGEKKNAVSLKLHRAKERLADYKVPKRWVVADDLPRTGTNKVQKSELLALFD